MDIEPIRPKKWLYIIPIVIVSLLLGGGFYYFYYFNKSSTPLCSKPENIVSTPGRLAITALPPKTSPQPATYNVQAEDNPAVDAKLSSQLNAFLSYFGKSSEEIAKLIDTLDSLDLNKDELLKEANK
jgi:hypothetical protein